MMRQTQYNLGDVVLCDLCNQDYTHDQGSFGGFVFSGKAVCPSCADRFEARVKQHNEDRYIECRAEAGETFADFIRRYRGGPATMTITSFDTADEMIDYMDKEAKKDANGK